MMSDALKKFDYLINQMKNPENKDEGSTEQKIKRKRRRTTICTSFCKFEIVRKVARAFGMREVPYSDQWNILWTDFSVSIGRVKSIKGFQRVNHFPGMSEICHKSFLAKNLNRMLKIFPDDYKFFPRTWCFPDEFNDAVEYSRRNPGKAYILKPGSGCRGQGIQVIKTFRNVIAQEKLICQVYISKPFLVDGLKFDLRIYTLVTSCDPLRIYVYNEGLARFATMPYRKPAGYNLSNAFMHLTNYSVNKFSSGFVSDGECGTKRSLTTLNQWLVKNDYDVDRIWASIDDVIIKTIISAQPVIKNAYEVSFPNHDAIPACFELLGFDILLDENLKPYVLEVNHSPSFNTDSVLDEKVKEALLVDSFKILNLAQFDTSKFIEQEKKKVQQRLSQSFNNKEEPNNQPIANEPTMNSQVMYKMMQESQEKWEEKNMGNYRKVYPIQGIDIYLQFFNQSQFSNTFSSRVREEVGKMHREELEEKRREELDKSTQFKPKILQKPVVEPSSLEQKQSPRSVSVQKINMMKKHSNNLEPLKVEPIMMCYHDDLDGNSDDWKGRESFYKGNYLISKLFNKLRESGYFKMPMQVGYETFYGDDNQEIMGSNSISRVLRTAIEKRVSPERRSKHGQPGDQNANRNEHILTRVDSLQPDLPSQGKEERSDQNEMYQSHVTSGAGREFLRYQKLKLLKQIG